MDTTDVKHQQQFLTDVEGSQSPQEVQMTLSFPVDAICVISAVQFIDQLQSLVLKGPDHLYICALDGAGDGLYSS